MVATTRVPLDDVLSKIGLGWFQFRLWWICGLGFGAAAVEVVLLAFVLPEIRRVWHLDEYQIGSLVTVVGLGSIVGEIGFGVMADKYGRRPVFIVTVLIIVVFGILSSFSPNPFWLCFLRFIVGFGYGGCIAVDFTLYSEFLPTEGRGTMLFMLSVFWPFGQVATCLLAWSIIPSMGWRVFIAACTLPIMLTAVARPLIPESPRWLLLQGRNQEATQVCIDMAELNGKSAQDVGLGDEREVCIESESISLEASTEPRPAASKTPFVPLFSTGLWRTTVGLAIYGVALNYITYGTLTLMPTLMKMKGIGTVDIYRSMLCNSLAQIPGCALAAYMATHFGRLCPMQIFLLVVAAALFSFSQVSSQTHVMISTMFASGFVEAGWAVMHVYVPEVYPTDVRASATGFLSAAGSLCAAVAPLVSARLLESKHAFPAILAFSSVALFASAASWLLLHIETKDRDLHDVSDEAGTAKEY